MESVGIKEASERIGVTKATICKMLQSQRLRGFKHHSGRWDISIRSVNEVIRRRKEANRQ